MIPFSTLSEKADFTLRAGLAYALMLLLFLLNIVMIPIPVIGVLEIPFILMVIYYWTIYRPTLIPPALVFVAGLIFDLLTAGLLGLGALIFTLTRFAISSQRNFLIGQPFIVVWFGFCVVSAAISLLSWLISTLMHWQFVSLFALWPDYAASVIIYPLIAFLLHLSHKILPDPQMPLTRQSPRRNTY